jgi:sensor histidine kinase YesM
MPLEKGGRVSIDIEKKDHFLIIVIQDNGVGRKNADGDGLSTGRGLRMTEEFYGIFKPIKQPENHL